VVASRVLATVTLADDATGCSLRTGCRGDMYKQHAVEQPAQAGFDLRKTMCGLAARASSMADAS
jgi:hypothetical protein